MGTYIISFLTFSFIFTCFYKKESYEKRYLITIYAALLSFIPLTVVNLIKNNNGEREIFVVKSWTLNPAVSLTDTLTGDTIPRSTYVYFEIDSADKELNFRIKKGNHNRYRNKSINLLEVHYIQQDSTNLPRYEITKERIKDSSKNIWISTLGIPNKNRKFHLYLPNDTNKLILKLALNEIKKVDSN